jgi:hypothetical protein
MAAKPGGDGARDALTFERGPDRAGRPLSRSLHAHVRQPIQCRRVGTSQNSIEGLAMKRSAMMLATVGALALTAIASTGPAEARRGFRPGLAVGGLIAGAAIAGAAASSAYAWAPGDPGPVYGYGGYGGGPGYYGGRSPYGYSYGGYGGYDESTHGGQPYYSRP